MQSRNKYNSLSQRLYNRKDGDVGKRTKVLGGKVGGFVDKECYV